MPENILVVEYEPRYTDRVRQALAGQPFTPQFAKDGEEALRAIEGEQPKLIVLSSVVPKVSTPELIRAIRNRADLSATPILLTVSGYNGKSPKQDAARMGASDILPKPYSETEFLGKVQQMLGVRGETKTWSPELDGDFTVRTAPAGGGGLTSNEIFGDLLEDDRSAPKGAKKTMNPKDDVDKMLADTLAGMMPQRKKEPAPAPAAPKPPEPKPVEAKPPAPQPPAPQPPPPAPQPAAAPAPAEMKRTQPGTVDLDKLLNDTLSGTRKPGAPAAAAVPRATVAQPLPQQPPPRPAGAPPRPAAPPAPAPQPAQAKYITEKLPTLPPDKVPVSQPIFPPAAPAAAAAPAEDEEPTDGVKFGQYVLLDRIATGGMAEVWKARMRGVEGFQKTVAIKKILPHLSDNQDFIEMFIDEAKLAAQLNHNNIIHIYDLGKIQSSYYIAMEYIDGYDLKTILKMAADRDQPLQVELALFIASKIAAALDYAHRKRDFEDRDLGLVHRDVSPQNVLISEEGDIKLCDFGIAKAASKASHTQAGALKGKLQYMSPEQAWGRNIDKRSDIFALATVLFELLTGRKLFTGDNELSILEQVREARVVPPSHYNDEVTPQIDAIVIKALQKDPAARYQTAGEMERDINQVLYSFKPTPTAADLAIFLHRLSTSEAHPLSSSPVMLEPQPIREPGQLKPVGAPAAAAVPFAAPAPPVAAAPMAEPAMVVPPATDKKLPIVPIAIAAVVVLAIGGWFAFRSKSAAPAAATSTVAAKPVGAQPVVPTSATSATLPAPGQVNAAPALGVPPTATTATFDPAKVDAEVQKRLAAERAKYEQQQAAKGQPTSTQVAQAQPVRPTPQPAAATPQPVTPAPQPVVPQPQPVVPAPQPAVQRPAEQPAPQPAEPQVARAHEGDLIPAGTEGLTPPRMTRQGALTYPPVARIERVQGTVLMSVLVSETGSVSDVRIIKGDARLNEAAMQSIRRSSFSPGMKDGVRVKSWVPVSINFKL